MKLTDRLAELEQSMQPLLEDCITRPDWLDQVKLHIEDIWRQRELLPAYNVDAENSCEEIASLPVTEEGEELADILALLQRTVNRYGIHVGTPGHMAYIPGNLNYLSALAGFIGAAANPYTGVNEVSPGAAAIQQLMIKWLAGLVGYPDSCAGDITSGGSIANLSAVVTARERHNIRAAEVAQSVAYYSERSHHSNAKALHIAGMGDCRQRVIPCDRQLKMDSLVLQQTLEEDVRKGLRPWLIIGNAGDTDTGNVDDLNRLADLAEQYRCWFHVDGAYGAGFALCEPGRLALAGIERSDSVTLDPHKGLFVTFGCGALLVKNPRALQQAHHFSGAYMRDVSHDNSPSSLSPELTRPFRALQLWLPLMVTGVAPYRAALEEKMLLAQYAHRRLQAVDGFWVGPEPQLSIVVFRYVSGDRQKDDGINEYIAETVREEGDFYASTTQLDGAVTLRLAILGLKTHRRTIDAFLDRVTWIVSGLSD